MAGHRVGTTSLNWCVRTGIRITPSVSDRLRFAVDDSNVSATSQPHISIGTDRWQQGVIDAADLWQANTAQATQADRQNYIEGIQSSFLGSPDRTGTSSDSTDDEDNDD